MALKDKIMTQRMSNAVANIGPPPIQRCGCEASSSSSVSDSFEDMTAEKQDDGPSPCIAPVKNNQKLILPSSSSSPPTQTPATTTVQPVLLQLLHSPTTQINLGVEINLSLPIISHVHPTSPLLHHLHVGDILLELDGVRSTELDYRDIHRWFHGQRPLSAYNRHEDGVRSLLLFLPGRNSPYNPEHPHSARFRNRRGSPAVCRGSHAEKSERNPTADTTPATAPNNYVDVLQLQKRPTSSSHDSTRQVFSRKSTADEEEADPRPNHEDDAAKNDNDRPSGSGMDPHSNHTRTPPDGPCDIIFRCNESLHSGYTLYLDEDEGTTRNDDKDGSSVNTPTRRIRPRCKEDTDDVEKPMEAPVSPSTTATTFSKSSEEGDDVVSDGGSGEDGEGASPTVDGGYIALRDRDLDRETGSLPMAPDLEESSSDEGSNGSMRSSSLLLVAMLGTWTNSALSFAGGSRDDAVGVHEDEEPCTVEEDRDRGQSIMSHTPMHDGIQVAAQDVPLDPETMDHVPTMNEIPLIDNDHEKSNQDKEGTEHDEQLQSHPELDVNHCQREQSAWDQTQVEGQFKQDSQCIAVADVLPCNNGIKDDPIVANNPDISLKQHQQKPPIPTTSPCEEEENWEKILQQQRIRPSPNFDVIYVKLGPEGNGEEDVSTIYGGKYNPSLHPTSNARIEDHLIGYMEEGQYHANKPPIYDYNTLSQLTLGRSHSTLSKDQIDRESQARKIQLEEQDYLMKKTRLSRLQRRHRCIEGIFGLLIIVAVGVLIGILFVTVRGKS